MEWKTRGETSPKDHKKQAKAARRIKKIIEKHGMVFTTTESSNGESKVER